jgi:hypothetical protein
VEFNDISLTAQPESTGMDWQSASRTNAPLAQGLAAIRTLVQHTAFSGEPVFNPGLFYVNQGALTWTVQVVL